MREPKTVLHRPAKALSRLQNLVGHAKSAAGNDRDPNRAAKVASILQEAFDVCLAARTGGPLPPEVDHDRAC